LVNNFGIRAGGQNPVWIAGHVTDVLELSATGILVATQTGGVWFLTPDFGFSLSRDWDMPNIYCLAKGPDGVHHFYAGGVSSTDGGPGATGRGPTTNGGYLYVTDPSLSVPLLSPWHPIPLPAIGQVWQMVVDAGSRRIILATDNGVYWSSIPMNPASDGYFWNLAIGLPKPTGRFSGLITATMADNQFTVIAAAWPWGADVASGHYGLFSGHWQGSDLVMQRANVSGTDQTRMTFTRLAGCENHPEVLYALSSDGDGHLFTLLQSSDGGLNWSTRPAYLAGSSDLDALRKLADGKGDGQGNGWNLAIGVSVTDPNTLAFGWQHGPFLSTDGGNSFVHTPGIHDDHHVIRFTNTDGTMRLYDGSDGGIFVSQGLFSPFESTYNRHR